MISLNDTTTAAITDLSSGTPSDNSVILEGADSDITDQLTNCYCHRPEVSTMIACNNPEYSIEWFSTSCLQTTKR